MLPPIDDAILQSNPRFAALHTTLAKQILNPNGSTKVHPAQKERDAVSEVCHLHFASKLGVLHYMFGYMAKINAIK